MGGRRWALQDTKDRVKIQAMAQTMVYQDIAEELATDNILCRTTMWKLNEHGDPLNPSHWNLREVLLVRSGRFWYMSEKENRALFLCGGLTCEEMDFARRSREKSCKPFTFSCGPPIETVNTDFSTTTLAAQDDRSFENFRMMTAMFGKTGW